MSHRIAGLVVFLAWAASAAGGQVVVPVFAWSLSGASGNRWSSELYLTNVGQADASVRYGGFLPGFMEVGTPCLPPIAPVPVPPHSTVVVPGVAVARDMGCPAFAVGGLVLDIDGDVRVTSRMVNTRGTSGPGGDVASGFGQEIPGLATDELLPAGAPAMLPGLVWDPLRCGSVRFDTYLYFANPGPTAATVTLLSGSGGDPLTVVLDGTTVTTPVALTVAPVGWLRVHVEPGGAWPAVCGPPHTFDLIFSSDAPIAALASVVDRTTQDPRTVLPVPIAE